MHDKMLIILGIFLTPIWVIGYICGFIIRPFLVGFYEGLSWMNRYAVIDNNKQLYLDYLESIRSDLKPEEYEELKKKIENSEFDS